MRRRVRMEGDVRQAGRGIFRNLLGDWETWRRTFFRYQLLITSVDDDT